MRMKAKKILPIMLAVLVLFNPIAPEKALAANSWTEATLIRSGDTMITDGNYQLSNGYKGTINIVSTASKVKVMGSLDGKTLAAASIVIAPRSRPLELTIENLKLSAPAGKSAINFGNVPGINYNIWPFNKSNADQPAPYSRTDTLLVSGDCSLSGGSGGAGVRVGDEVHLIIDKAAGLSDANACLSALGGENGPGIGGNSGFFSGSVSINGGTITATGGSNGVGIGNLFGTIIINGGEINAISHDLYCPAIGNEGIYMLSGLDLKDIPPGIQFLMQNQSSSILPGETIIINDGSVTASAGNFPGIFAMSGMKYFGYGNKLLDYRQNCLGRLTINGGTVTAHGSCSANFMFNTAIQGSQVEINSGTVSAINNQGAGLGGISTVINGGLVFAVGNAPVDSYSYLSPSKILGDQIDEMNKAIAEGGAPEEATDAINQLFSLFLNAISGQNSSTNEGGGSGIVVFPDDSLTINDGIVIAQGGPDSAGIGRTGLGSSAGIYALFGMENIDLTPGPITINGGSIFATGGKDGAGLGGGGRIYFSGRPTVIATRGGDTAKDVWAELIQARSSGTWCTYLRLEVKDKNSGKPLAGKRVTISGVPYFSNMDGVIGCFVPRPFLRGGGYGPIKISTIASAPPGFSGGSTEINSQENSIRATIELDYPLQNITLQGVSGDNSADIPLQLTPAFDPLKTDYTLYVENSVNRLKVIPEKVPGDTVTTVQVNGIAVKAEEAAEVPLQFGENNILVTVSLPAEEWAPEAIPVQKQYSIKVNRNNMKIVPNTLTISNGDTERLVVQYDDSYSGERTGTWSIADSTIVSVEESSTEPIIINPIHTIPGTIGAKVTGLKPGTTVVTFTNTATGAQQDCIVTVEPAFTITPNPLTVYTGEKGTLAVTFENSYKGQRFGSWSVDDNTVASIDQNGVVTGKKAGTAIVTYTGGQAPAGTAVKDGNTLIEATAARVKSAYDISKTVSVVVKQGSFTVTFDPNGGSPKPESVIVKHDTTVTRPADPSQDGMIFLGWYTALQGSLIQSGNSINLIKDKIAKKWDFSNDKVTTDMTLYAYWGLEPKKSNDSSIHRPLPSWPHITGPETFNLTEGYSSIDQAYTFGGYPAPTFEISLTEPNTAGTILAGNTLTIPSGLDVGSYTVTLTATNSSGTVTKTITVNVSPAVTPTLPTIEGPDTINLTVGYDNAEETYTFDGYPAPTYGISSTEPNTAGATLAGNTLTIPEGLDEGTYTITLTATNSSGTVTKTITVNVSPAVTPTLPTIEGPDTINLTVGYDDAEDTYTFDGYPAPTYGISSTEPNTASATLAGNTLTIPEGLDEGTYTVTLTATNSVGTETKTITVNVNSAETAPTIDGPDVILLPPPYTSDDYAYTVTGSPTTYEITNISSSPGFFSFDGVNLSIASALDCNNSPFTLTLMVTNSAGTATKDVTVYVIMMEPMSFDVYEGDPINEELNVTGAGSYTLLLQNEPTWVSLSDNTLIISPPVGTLTDDSPEYFTADIVITVSGGETYTTPIYIRVNP